MPADADVSVICIGCGSEYVFRDFAANLRARGIACVEVDMMQPGWRDEAARARLMPNRVLFTSQHPYLGSSAWAHHYGQEIDLITLAEAMDLLEPERSYYVAHDLMVPLKDEEAPALHAVTAALMPTGTFWYLRRFTQVRELGWIRTLRAPDAAAIEPIPLLFLLSEVGAYIARGVEHFLEVFAPILALKPVVKLPIMAGTEPILEALAARDITVLDATVNTAVAIEASRIVVSNGLSSTLAESSLMGRVTVCVLDGIHSEALQRATLSGYEDIFLLAPLQAGEALASWRAGPARLPPAPAARVKPFDFDFALALALTGDGAGGKNGMGG